MAFVSTSIYTFSSHLEPDERMCQLPDVDLIEITKGSRSVRITRHALIASEDNNKVFFDALYDLRNPPMVGTPEPEPPNAFAHIVLELGPILSLPEDPEWLPLRMNASQIKEKLMEEVEERLNESINQAYGINSMK